MFTQTQHCTVFNRADLCFCLHKQRTASVGLWCILCFLFAKQKESRKYKQNPSKQSVPGASVPGYTQISKENYVKVKEFLKKIKAE
jgi:hypothetical protein